MTKKEFSAAVALAQSGIPLSHHSSEALLGFGTKDFKPVSVTIFAAAECIRWQCAYLFGGWDQEAQDACWFFFRHRVNVVGLGDHCLMDPRATVEQVLAGSLFSGLLT